MRTEEGKDIFCTMLCMGRDVELREVPLDMGAFRYGQVAWCGYSQENQLAGSVINYWESSLGSDRKGVRLCWC